MKRVLILVVVSLLLFSLVSAGITSRSVEDINNSNQQSVINGDDDSDDENDTTEVEEEEDNETELENETEIEEKECEEWKCTKWTACVNSVKTRNCVQANNLCLEEQEKPKISKRCEEKERLKIKQRPTECPEECTCSGSTIKCTLQSGREMTITAGKSGNVIVQVKGENMTTNVTLYKSGDKVYGLFKNNETKEVKVLPDQVKEKIKEKIKARLENEKMVLNENGEYEFKAQKRARLFLIIPIKIVVDADVDAETGDVSNVQSQWWSFLARDEE